MKEQIYFCEPDFLLSYLTKIENATAEDIQAANDRFGSETPESIMSIDGDTAKINIIGILTRKGPSALDRYFGYSGTSYQEIIDCINEAEENPEIKTIKTYFDTPGGEVAGVDAVYQAFAGCKKEYIAINTNLIASAGYYVASPANKILSTAPTNATGSIGVIITAVSFDKAYEKFGVKIVHITSQSAPNKYPDINTKKGVSILQKRADDLEAVFLKRISEGRGISIDKIKSDFGKGGVLLAEDALAAGMIDGLLYENNQTETTAQVADDSAEMSDNNKTTPEGGETEETMTFDELMAQNPDAKARYDAEIAKARAEGVEAGKKEVQGRIDATVNYIGNADYKGIEPLAREVLQGKAEPSALKGAVAAFDMMKEKEKGEVAKSETEELPETPGDANHQQPNAESIETQADAQYRLDKMLGEEV
jgi:ClpP class serine protease